MFRARRVFTMYIRPENLMSLTLYSLADTWNATREIANIQRANLNFLRQLAWLRTRVRVSAVELSRYDGFYDKQAMKRPMTKTVHVTKGR